ncbi:prolyl oligopeptidase family serine peptidase [Halobaculum sp. MBLA0147]|uniref:S9 family peptidase n=1 Tax=Halobaculum sp. MBLA0147 TaxID=3079934 RepID=UPI003525F8AE
MTSRIRAADYHELAKPGSVDLHDEEERVAFTRVQPEDDEQYESTVYVADLDDGDTRRFTLAEGRDAEPRWSPSGDRLAFTSTRGADDDRQQLWVLPSDGGEARQVTEVVGGVSSIAWSPDGTRIAFCQRVHEDDRAAERDISVPDEYDPEEPDPRVIDRTVYRSAERYFDGAYTQVYTVEIETGDVTRVTEEPHEHAAPAWGDGTTLYFTAEKVGVDPDDSDEYDIVAYDTDTEETTDVYRGAGWGAALAVTTDHRIAHLYTEPGRASIEQTELHVYDRETATCHEVTADLDRTLGYEAAPQWGPDEERVYFTTPDEGATSLWSAPGDASEEPEREYRGGAVSAASVGEDAVALARSEWDHPGDVFVVADGEERRLTEMNEAYLETVDVQEPESITITSEQGEVDGWVLTPPAFDETETYPLAVEIHGGPHAMWTTSGTMWHEFQTLAARGYVVFWSNPRGSTGYGEAYSQAIERNWGEVTATDVMAGVEAVAERSYVDESSVFLTGGSFGGYMTSWLVGQTDRFTAAVSQRGVYDLTGFYGSTDGAYKLVEGDYDTTPWEEPAFLWEQSPVAHADAVDTPTLVVHSDDDYRTPANTAELFHRILRKHGVDTRLVRYPREGHELSRSGEPAHVVDRIERIVRWFDGYSPYHDGERALDRPDEDGLSAGEDEEEGEEDDGQGEGE